MNFEQWFMSKQGMPYDSMRVFAQDAWDAAVEAERERICAAIKAEDDHCADGDYMMDSDDCIKVVRGAWQRPDWNGSNALAQGPGGSSPGPAGAMGSAAG